VGVEGFYNTVYPKVYDQVAAAINPLFKDTLFNWRPCSFVSEQAFDSAKRADLVIAFVAGYIAPFFSCILNRGIVWGMIGHAGLLNRLVMAQGVSSAAGPLYIPLIIPPPVTENKF